MALPHDIHAPVDVTQPEPNGFCDRCNRRFLKRDLSFQYDFRGPVLQNLRIEVCPSCLDDPQPQLKPVIIPGPDPTPVKDPRPGYQVAEMGPTPVVNVENIIGD